MRQVHKAGEKAFVDYAGLRPTIVDAVTGEVIAVELFVAVLGASNYTFAEASRTQQSADWITSHVHAVEYFGGVPAVWVPDQLRTGVTVPCRYEPGVQRTYADWAQHYHTVVIPARPAKPRDKAKVEVAVQVVERWLLAAAASRDLFQPPSAEYPPPELLTALNARPMKGYGGRSRRDLFEHFDRPALQALPAERFVHADWLQARVNIDYHVEVDRHYYSVPYPLVHEVARRAPLRQHGRDLPARSRGSGSMRAVMWRAGTPRWPSTCRRPTARIRNGARRASSAGAPRSARRPRPSSQQILESRPHPEQGYRSCLGLLRLAKRYGPARLNAACARAVAVGARSYRHVDSMLKHGLDRQPLLADATDVPAGPHPRQRPRTRVLPRRRALMMTMTRDRLRALRLSAMADAYVSQYQDAGTSALGFDERFSMLVDAEQLFRDNRALTRRLKEAKLRLPHACLEDLDYAPRRGWIGPSSGSSPWAAGSSSTTTS